MKIKNNMYLCFLLLSLIGCSGANEIKKNKEKEIVKINLHQKNTKLVRSRQLKNSALAMTSAAPSMINVMPHATKRNQFLSLQPNGVRQVEQSPVSTFSIDVDTAAFSYVRHALSAGDMPPRDIVRIEEMINYFDYNYPAPTENTPFAVKTEIATTPWNKDSLLLQVGFKAKEPILTNRPSANLVFLLDVSGSMSGADRLGLVQKGIDFMVKQLNANDRVSVVVYAGKTALLLDGVTGNKQAQIISVINKLDADGYTNGSSGIHLAYKAARQNFIKKGINRIILATDGDFNLGTVDHQSLIDLVKREAKSGVELSVLGVGDGNFNDATMEQLADQGNGNYAYLDSVKEAYRVLGRNMLSTLFTVARDVKIQVEFNPAHVAEYRLIGYENRGLKRDDFKNDDADAGELGAGHTVTALYEITLNDSKTKRIDPLRYKSKQSNVVKSDELAFVKVRYKPLNNDKSVLKSYTVKKQDIKSLNQATNDFKFAAAVTSFGQLLRQSKYNNGFSYDKVIELVQESKGKDKNGERGAFLGMIEMAKNIQHQ